MATDYLRDHGQGQAASSGSSGDLLLHDTLRLIRRPVEFFSSEARERSFLVPFLVGVLSIQVAVIAGGFAKLAGIEGVQGAAYVVLQWSGIVTGQHMVGLELTGTRLLSAILLAPVVAMLLLLGVTTLIHSLVVLVVGDANGGFGNTFRVVSYASVVNLFNWVPVAGLPLNLLGLYLIVIASEGRIVPLRGAQWSWA
jgi:hypothetical protein